MNKKSMIATAAAVTVAGGLVAWTACAQNAQPGPTGEFGEVGNWGLVPFAAVPAVALRPEDRAAIRTLEDQQIKERRAFEDKYETELRQLIQKHANEREALRNRLSNSR